MKRSVEEGFEGGLTGSGRKESLLWVTTGVDVT